VKEIRKIMKFYFKKSEELLYNVLKKEERRVILSKLTFKERTSYMIQGTLTNNRCICREAQLGGWGHCAPPLKNPFFEKILIPFLTM